MSKVLVDRELLARLQERLDPHIDARDWGMLCEAFRAQPAEADGVAVVAWANEALSAFISADCKAYGDSRGGAAGSAAGAHQTPLVRQSDHLGVLSAVTAERDRLREALEGMLEYFPEGASDGECFAVDAARAAMAAKEGDL